LRAWVHEAATTPVSRVCLFVFHYGRRRVCCKPIWGHFVLQVKQGQACFLVELDCIRATCYCYNRLCIHVIVHMIKCSNCFRNMLPAVIVFGHFVDLQHINKYIYNQQTCFSCMGLYGPSTTPQPDGESLANYIANVKSYVKVFRLENPEADIVQTILDGLSPACRPYLVFAEKPTSALIWIICVSRQLMPNMSINCDRHFPSLQLARRRLVDPCPPAIYLDYALQLSVFIATAKGI
jgi:hypothetical protein